MASRENSDWQLGCSVIRERGARLLASEQWADCSFLVGAAAVPARAHRLILAMASPVFQAMFYGPVAEGDAPIPVPDIQPGAFNKLLQYVYTDEADLENYKIAFEVYYAAEKYMLPHLKTLCTAYLLDNLVPQNACGIYELANFIGDTKLEKDSLEVIQYKTKLALAPDSSFEHLALGTVVHIFSLNKLTIDSELDLLAAAERYVLAWQERVNEMADINTSSSDVDSDNDSASNTSSSDVDSDNDSASNTSSSDVDSGNDSASNRIDKYANNKDIIKFNGNSNGDIKIHGENISNDRQGEDEATAENQEITPSDTKPPQPACPEVVNRARSEATCRITVNNVSKMEEVEFPDIYVRNMLWLIRVERESDNKNEHLDLSVMCEAESKPVSWSCKALIDFRLISHKPDTKPYCHNEKIYICLSGGDSLYVGYFMALNDVLDPEKGYVKDDAITLEVRVVAEPPQGLTWHSKDRIGSIDIKDDLVQAILRRIRFLTLTAKELADYKPKLSLLTDQDIAAIIMNIVSTETDKLMPRGFDTWRRPRFNPRTVLCDFKK